MGLADVPAVPRGQFVGQVGGAGARLDGRLHARAVTAHEGIQGGRVIHAGTIGKHLAVDIQDANLNGAGMVVKSDEYGYSVHGLSLGGNGIATQPVLPRRQALIPIYLSVSTISTGFPSRSTLSVTVSPTRCSRRTSAR